MLNTLENRYSKKILVEEEEEEEEGRDGRKASLSEAMAKDTPYKPHHDYAN